LTAPRPIDEEGRYCHRRSTTQCVLPDTYRCFPCSLLGRTRTARLLEYSVIRNNYPRARRRDSLEKARASRLQVPGLLSVRPKEARRICKPSGELTERSGVARWCAWNEEEASKSHRAFCRLGPGKQRGKAKQSRMELRLWLAARSGDSSVTGAAVRASSVGGMLHAGRPAIKSS
jgi:hypothetical protein